MLLVAIKPCVGKIMPLITVSGDPLLTNCQVVAFGYNARGQSESRAEQIRLYQTYPAIFSVFRRQARKGKIKSGIAWHWNETTPNFALWIIRESSFGATRIRYVQSIVMNFVRDYKLYNIRSLALIRPGTPIEYEELHPILEQWLDPLPIPIVLYETYESGIKADEALA